MKRVMNDEQLKRKSLDRYKKMGKKELLISMASFINNFDRLRYKHVGLQLENNYLERKIEMLTKQLNFYKAQVNKRTFKHGIPD